MKNRKLLALILCAVLLLLLFTGCGASESMAKGEAADSMNRYDAEVDYTYAVADEGLTSSSQTGEAAVTNQKLIRTVYLDAETEDMETLLSEVESRISQLGGYVEARNVYNGKLGSTRRRSADLTIRIPAEKLDQFVKQVSGVSNVVSHSENTKDVTLSYVASESRVKALETEEARLLELVTKAEKLEDLLTLESKLTEIRSELEQHKSQLRLYDSQVNYSTIHLNVTEVVEYTEVEEEEPAPKSLWGRMSKGFVDSFNSLIWLGKELLVLVAYLLPYLGVPVLIVAVVVVIFVIRNRRRK